MIHHLFCDCTSLLPTYLASLFDCHNQHMVTVKTTVAFSGFLMTFSVHKELWEGAMPYRFPVQSVYSGAFLRIHMNSQYLAFRHAIAVHL